MFRKMAGSLVSMIVFHNLKKLLSKMIESESYIYSLEVAAGHKLVFKR